MTVELVHGASCECVRCLVTQPGNLLAFKSGFWIDPTLREEHRAKLAEIAEILAQGRESRASSER